MKTPAAILLTVLGYSLTSVSLHAADVLQSASVPAGNTWNNTTFWGGNALVSGNNYITAPFGATETPFTVGSTAWQTAGNMRDAEGSSTFNGGALVINPNTRLLGKALGGATSTANIVLNGGFIHSAPNAAGSSTLAGNISFGTGITLGAIGVLANSAGPFTFNINSTIVGGSDVTLQLTMNGSDRVNHLNLLGDISGFAGTFYVSTANGGVASGSSFSIQSSAPLATLQLATTSTNFRYNLIRDTTFGSLIVGATTLGAGTYSFADLNAIAPGSFLDNGGSITVVPEPSAYAAGVIGLLALAAFVRRKRIA